MKKLTEIIKSLIEETKKIEIVKYKVAIERFKLYNKEPITTDEIIYLRDKEYFDKIDNIIKEKKFENSETVLKNLQEVQSHDGCLSHYTDPYYAQIIKDITNQAIKLLEIAELQDTKDKEILKLYKLQQIQAKKLISKEEVELLFGVSSSFLDKLRKRKVPLPSLGGGSGGILMFNKDEVEQYMMKHL
jgi:hypothetical protein